MKVTLPVLCLLANLTVVVYQAQMAETSTVVPTRSGVGVEFRQSDGAYAIWQVSTGWRFTGRLGEGFKFRKTQPGRDSVGIYRELVFARKGSEPVSGVIRRYDNVPVVWFGLHYDRPEKGSGLKFPYFKSIPNGLSQFSYQDRTFSPPSFSLAKTATPWMFFDSKANAAILSPASNFMISAMTASGPGEAGLSLNEQLSEVPSGTTQDAILVVSSGIGNAWNTWGHTMRSLFHKKAPQNDADPTLKRFGYWTDNGADYYYNYDSNLGYAGTLRDLVKRYREEGIPIGYLQLDSWWYSKSTFDPSGRKGGAKKNNRLPLGSWNRYGGLMDYTANADLFPDGLPAFQREVGLPLVVHNRWIDRTSPYHDRYKISGVAAVDPIWWNDVAEYLKQAGVICYEQDWLDQIYLNSPAMAQEPGVGDAFANGMASACKNEGLSMQYCMGTPRFFLQGLNYPNLTTIRTSGDRFEPGKWADFLYVSRLAQDVGVWPWCDVFKSSEMGNMTLAVLSAGPVGTGDAIGRENKGNILKAVRQDGVIVKPDVPLTPIDQTYIDGAQKSGAPFVASTYTDHLGLITRYLFAFPRAKSSRTLHIDPGAIGVTKQAYVLDLSTGRGNFWAPGALIEEEIGRQGYAYHLVSPVGRSGIALLGDLSKIVPTGKQRIAAVSDTAADMKVTVEFAKGESAVTIQVACTAMPAVRSLAGDARLTAVPGSKSRYAIELHPTKGGLRAQFVVGRL